MTNNDKDLINKNILKYLNNKVFTGCALGVSSFKNDTFIKNRFFSGKTDKEKGALLLEKDCFFDTASLTKPLVTLLSILALIKDGKINFEDKLETLLSKKVPEDKKEIKLIHLISHFSGLPSHKPYFKELILHNLKERKNILLNLILNESLDYYPGKNYLYSDLDYILLGFIVEEKSGKHLDTYWLKKIADPLGITSHFLFPRGFEKEEEGKYVVTGVCPWSGQKLCGVVHDDNCRAFGSTAGHAGLFSTLEGVMKLLENLLLLIEKKEVHPSFFISDLQYLLRKRGFPHGKYGFDTPSGKNPGSGHYFSDETIGHLGFTGTSFWIDLKKRIIVVLLTNRVIYGENLSKIKEMRPALHNVVMSIIDREGIIV